MGRPSQETKRSPADSKGQEKITTGDEEKVPTHLSRPRTYDALLQLVKPNGCYQCLVLLCLTLANTFPGMVTLTHTFARASLTKHFCDVNATVGEQLLANCWSVEASSDECRVRLNCSGESITEMACQDWNFDQSIFIETVVTRFRLVCGDSYLADLPATGFFAGFLVGSSLYGLLADRFGRMPLALAGMANMTLMTALAALAPVYWLYAVAMAIAGVGTGGTTTVIYSSVIERTDAANRIIWGCTVAQGWALGTLILTLVAYMERRYQAQLLWLCAASLPLYPLVLLAGESSRWLVSTGRVERADAIIERAARLNGTSHRLPAGFTAKELYEIDQQPARAATVGARAKSEKPKNGKDSGQKSAGFLDLFRNPGLRRATLLSWIHWFAASMTYYGISLGADSIGGNIFVNIVLMAGVEFPARFLGMASSLCRIGRKPVLYVSFALSAVFLAAMVAVFEQSASGTAAANVALAVLSKLSITVAFGFVWLYYSELFPTVIRSAGVGSGSTLARVGAMLSTQLLALRSVWGPLPFVIFGVGPLLACLVIYFLPETVGHDLPETLVDGEKFVLSGGGRCCCRGERSRVGPQALSETSDNGSAISIDYSV